jgi:hypothetical protein
MNSAERMRDDKIGLMDDLELLRHLAGPEGTRNDEEISLAEFKAFIEMFEHVKGGGFLSRKQRLWAEEAMKRITPLPAGTVPRGREVPLPLVLQNLPKLPPGRTK